MNRRRIVSLLSLTTLAIAARGLHAEPANAVSDSDLFSAFDYAANPALTPVEKASSVGDTAGAKKALADYLRGRTTVPWDVSPRVADRTSVRWSKTAAASALIGDVVVVAIPHSFPNGEIDWLYNPTGGSSGLPANSEWLWQLNRMAWWGDLGRAYQATGDERYAAAWVRQLRSWATQCVPPPGLENGAASPWRTIECGIRMQGVWPASYQTFLLSPSFTDEDIVTYVKLSIEHARYLSAFPSSGNWLTMEMNGLYCVGALFPELKAATTWRKQAGDSLHHELSVQFLPDGAQIELTPGYHNVALDNVLGLYLRASQVGRTEELPSDYLARMEGAFDYDLYLLTPDRGLPKFNDSWSYSQIGRMAQAAKLFPSRADFAYLASDGKEGATPAITSHGFAYAGYYAMRDGWGRDACYAAFDAGPLGFSHTHQDKLNIVVWAYGRELLYDCGGGSYEHSRYRAYATDTFSHNTVLVDGKPQRRQEKDRWANVAKAPLGVPWESAPTHDYVEGVYSDGYGNVTDRIATHARRVLFVKPTPATPAFWVVADRLQPNDAAAHTYQARWSLLTTKSATDPKTGITVTTDGGHPNLAIVPLLTDGLIARSATAQTEPELLAWNVRKDLDPEYVPATTIQHTRSGSGEQRFLTLLLPVKASETDPAACIADVTFDPPSYRSVIRLNDGTIINVDAGGSGIAIEMFAPGDKSGTRVAGGLG